MASFFFPCSAVLAETDEIATASFILRRRKWETSTFDIATLATKHALHFRWELMAAFLSDANCEIEVLGVSDRHLAADTMRMLQTMLYIEGIAPFIVRLCTTYSINEYSGINARDSDHLNSTLPQGMRKGLRSDSGRLEGWIHDPALLCISPTGMRSIDSRSFTRAVEYVGRWGGMEKSQPLLHVARSALQTAPLIPELGSSLLHLWQGIEALFPKVQTELSYRISLLVAQLAAPIHHRRETFQVARRSYSDRSAAAHGSFARIGSDEWILAWQLLTRCAKAALTRGTMPTADDLEYEILE